MTKIILHGGYSMHADERNNAFYREMLASVPRHDANVLVAYFAKDEGDAMAKFPREQQRFLDNAEGKSLSIRLATQENFINEIKDADILYLGGGKSLRLLNLLKSYPDFKNAIKGKVVAGESAGANVLSKYFYSKTEGGVFEGLGVVPIRFCPHFDHRPEAVDALSKYSPELPEVLLNEYEMTAMEI